MGNINITTDDEVNHLEVVGMSAAAAIDELAFTAASIAADVVEEGKEDDMANYLREVVSKHYDAAINNKKENSNDDQ